MLEGFKTRDFELAWLERQTRTQGDPPHQIKLHHFPFNFLPFSHVNSKKMEQAKRLQIDRHPIYARASPLRHLREHLFHFVPNEQSSDAKHTVMSANMEMLPSHHTIGRRGDIWSWPIAPGFIIQSASEIGNCLNSGVGNCCICTVFFSFFSKRNVGFVDITGQQTYVVCVIVQMCLSSGRRGLISGGANYIPVCV